MTTGRSEFKVRINRQAIAEIAERAKHLTIDIKDGIRAAPYEDIQVSLILRALASYLADRRCEPDFEVVTNE